MGAGLAERLGFAAADRVAVVHCDDIGMCHAANVGAFEVLLRGVATSGSLMVPCPGFEEAAAMAGAHPEIDLGVHLTLTAEWETYRWGPVAGAAAVPSLVDEHGYLPRSNDGIAQRADLDEVETELRAQIERALAAGIDVTHLDAHMGTVFIPPLLEVYAKLALEYRLPVFALRPQPEALALLGAPGAAEAIEQQIGALERAGWPIFDDLDAHSLGFEPGQGERHNLQRLAGLGPGVSYFITHPARGGEELSAIAPDAHARDFEAGFYAGDAGRRALEREGIRTVGMRALRDLVRELA